MRVRNAGYKSLAGTLDVTLPQKYIGHMKLRPEVLINIPHLFAQLDCFFIECDGSLVFTQPITKNPIGCECLFFIHAIIHLTGKGKRLV